MITKNKHGKLQLINNKIIIDNIKLRNPIPIQIILLILSITTSCTKHYNNKYKELDDEAYQKKTYYMSAIYHSSHWTPPLLVAQVYYIL